MSKEIYKTNNFVILIPKLPHVSREEGGHIFISPKVSVVDRTELPPKIAIELMRLTMILGEAMVMGLNKQGIDIGRIHYQDNGNWDLFKPTGPQLHIHLYGRAKNSTIQKYGEALRFPLPNTGFYDTLKPFNQKDLEVIKSEMDKLFLMEKYQDSNWCL